MSDLFVEGFLQNGRILCSLFILDQQYFMEVRHLSFSKILFCCFFSKETSVMKRMCGVNCLPDLV